MIKVLFVCHGNICRSPMAEFVLRDMVVKKGWSKHFQIASAATSTEEIGNPVHPGTRRKLRELGIACDGKVAVQMTPKDFDRYDYLIGMDVYNIRNMRRISGHGDDKIHLLLDFAGEHADIADPWYTGDFETTYQDVVRGCLGFIKQVESMIPR
ncbi:MAG: low molecular weight phosphotyrosine protein phosphatase [Clostridium sp.]|jgi:protein-tyrosine phosphatase|nr:low molecular weight phosphotyrosine protein phosphatase [Clostridium sp.]